MNRSTGVVVERYEVRARDWPPALWWLAVPVMFVVSMAGFAVADWLTGLIWPSTRDGLTTAVVFALVWVVAFLLVPLLIAHRRARGTRYVVAGEQLSYERGSVTHGVACERVTALRLDPGSGWREWRGYAPSLRVTTVDGETVTFPPIALWTRARREVIERDLRRACGLPGGP